MTVGCVCTGATSSLRCVWPLPVSTTAHSARRLQGARREVRVEPHGEIPEEPASQLEPFSLIDEEPGGSRPPCLGEPRGPLEGVQRHTVEHIVDDCPFVQILDVPVPQLENQLVEFMQKIDSSTLEQVIAVPKNSLDRIPQRFVDWRRPQKAEQLVEVPTVVSLSSLQLTAEQIIDIPVPLVIMEVFKLFSLDKVR